MFASEVVLKSARYGKDKIRLFRVKREGSFHYVVEYNVTVLLEGDIDVAYTKADNGVVVATDSIKNITYYLAKLSDHILIPERFALHLGTHILSRYAHIHKAFITIEQLRWSRITVSGEQKAHSHSFYRDGDDKRIVEAVVEKGDSKKLTGTVSAGISDLLVLKSTGSAFEGYIQDEYTTLVEVPERIFSTSIDLTYTFSPVSIATPTDLEFLDFDVPQNLAFDSQGGVKGKGEGGVWDALGVAERARTATLDVFATDESASVQVGRAH
ncbi:uricase [Gyrodon lividus]|nr:uricase [Gyrodon lividus]